jgi:glycosyltransferase involved in cell wall biosynthesis
MTVPTLHQEAITKGQIGGCLRIVTVSWRDLAHPDAGGAEVLMDHVLRGLRRRGHDVTLVCGGPVATGRPYNVVDAGGTYSQYVRAPAICVKRFRDADVVIDVQNGMPYFSPLWRRRPMICLVHHVHTDQWATRFPAVLASVFRTVERKVMPFVYRNREFVAISRSTADALAAIGVRPSSISIIQSGVEIPQGSFPTKTDTPMLLSLNRLVPHKRIDLLLKSWERASAHIDGRLVVAGDGPLLHDLQRQAASIPRVEIRGRVSEEEKRELLASSWAVLSTAHHEGWGMSLLEGAAFGTPALAVDAPGVRDAVVDGETGRLVRVSNETELPEIFGRAMVAFVKDQNLREELGIAARQRVDEFSWDRALDRWEGLLREIASPA